MLYETIYIRYFFKMIDIKLMKIMNNKTSFNFNNSIIKN